MSYLKGVIHYTMSVAIETKRAKKAIRNVNHKIRQEEPILPKPKPEPGFIKYIWNDAANRKYLLTGLLLNLVMFLLYKFCYPYPDFCSDAEGYIYAALKDAKSFYRPFGYSRFLQILHNFTNSHYLTVAIQYFILVIAAQFSFFSVAYLYPFQNKKVKLCAWLLTTVNPCLLVLANMMMSDALFTAFSAIWFTLCLWIVRRKQWWSLILQLFFLYASFQIRYNALYYPVFTGFIFLFTRKLKLPYRLVGMTASFFLIYGAYSTIKKTNYKNTGADVFAGFNGWQMANNGLMIYKKTDIKTEDFEDKELQVLDMFTKRFIDSLSLESKKKMEQGSISETPFLWDKNSPLRRYAIAYAFRYKINYIHGWYQVAPLYQRYGWYIIKNNPGLFTRHYLLPNLYHYIVPPREMMSMYDKSNVSLNDKTYGWLPGIPKNLSSRTPALQKVLMYPYPVLHALLLLFCFAIPIVCLWKRGKQALRDSSIMLPAMIWYLFIGADLAFSTFASPVTLRYVCLLFIIGFGLPFYFLDQFLSEGKQVGEKKTNQ
jgi:hypothetical protein